MSRLRHYPLRIHPGWTVWTDFFMDCDPKRVSPDDKRIWLDVFTQDMFYISYDEKYGLDLGWFPESEPNGEFILDLVTYKDFESLLTIKTRNLHEIADAIDKITWGVSQGILPSSDPTFSLDQITPPFRLQPLKVRHTWKIEKNRFIERDWETVDPQEIRDYLRDDLLLLRNIRNKKIHVRTAIPSRTGRGGNRPGIVRASLSLKNLILIIRKSHIELIPPEVLKRWWIGLRRHA